MQSMGCTVFPGSPLLLPHGSFAEKQMNKEQNQNMDGFLLAIMFLYQDGLVGMLTFSPIGQ